MIEIQKDIAALHAHEKMSRNAVADGEAVLHAEGPLPFLSSLSLCFFLFFDLPRVSAVLCASSHFLCARAAVEQAEEEAAHEATEATEALLNKQLEVEYADQTEITNGELRDQAWHVILWWCHDAQL
eukprot:3641995-Rhodomonas_salina.1